VGELSASRKYIDALERENAALKQRLETEFPGRKLIHTRLSNMTEDKPEQGRSKCQFRS